MRYYIGILHEGKYQIRFQGRLEVIQIQHLIVIFSQFLMSRPSLKIHEPNIPYNPHNPNS